MYFSERSNGVAGFRVPDFYLPAGFYSEDISMSDAHKIEDGSWLLIDGKAFCLVHEICISPPMQVQDSSTGGVMEIRQHKLILDKPVYIDLLDSRSFRVRFDANNSVSFEVFEGAEDGSWILGCPRPATK